MAANFRVDYSRQTEKVVGGARVIDIFEVGFFTIPSDIYAQTSIDLSFWTLDEWQPIVGVLADDIETVAGYPFVAAQNYIQDINRAGYLIDVMEISVTSDDGKLEALLRQPLDTISYHPQTVVPLIAALNTKLNATEAA